MRFFSYILPSGTYESNLSLTFSSRNHLQLFLHHLYLFTSIKYDGGPIFHVCEGWNRGWCMKSCRWSNPTFSQSGSPNAFPNLFPTPSLTHMRVDPTIIKYVREGWSRKWIRECIRWSRPTFSTHSVYTKGDRHFSHTHTQRCFLRRPPKQNPLHLSLSQPCSLLKHTRRTPRCAPLLSSFLSRRRRFPAAVD